MSITFPAPRSAQTIARPRWTAGPLAALKRLWAAYNHWRTEQAAIAALRGLTDRELKDIGLTRGEIVHAARGHAVGGRPSSRHRRRISTPAAK
jgi:uncharacterized protein YjiS (DUF1127 family)